MTDSPSTEFEPSIRRDSLGTCVAITTLCVALACAATITLDLLIEPLYARPGPWQYILTGMSELPVAAAALVACWLSYMLAGRYPVTAPRVPVFVLVGVSVLLPFAMRVFVFEGYLLEVDEFMLSLQADMFSQGVTAIQVPRELDNIARAAHPYMANHDAGGEVWAVFYLPVFASLLALADVLGSQAIVNPLLAGVSVLMMWSIARTLWPHDNLAAPVAAVLLVSTPQFLFPAATGFALTAHLAFNLVWLRLVLAGRTKHLFLAAIVGILAIGLHRPHVHLLFAFPFVLAWMRGWQERGLGTAVLFGVGYSAALYIWLGWADWSIAWATDNWSNLPLNPLEFKALARYAALSEANHGRFEELYRYWIMGHNLLRLFAWLNPAVLCLFVLGFVLWRRLSLTEQLILVAVLTSLLPYTYLMPNPSIGWGYRFAIPALGPMVLSGVAAWRAFRGPIAGRDRSTGFVVMTTAFAILVLFPLHGWRAATDLRAHAAAQEAMSESNSDFILLDHFSFRTYHLRNDADLVNMPIFLAMPYLSNEARRDLCSGDYNIITASAGEYEALGVEDRSRRFHETRTQNVAMIAELRALGCRIDDSALRAPD